MAIENADGLASNVCRNCLATAQSIESKLQRFREVAQESLQKLQVQGNKPLKYSTRVGSLGDNTSTMLPDVRPAKSKRNSSTL